MNNVSRSAMRRFRPWHQQSTTTKLHIACALNWIQQFAAITKKPVEEILAQCFEASCAEIWGPRPTPAARPLKAPAISNKRDDH